MTYIADRGYTLSYEKVVFKTMGDRIEGSLKEVGGKGLFVREIDEALRDGRIDMAIHCLKDIPGDEKTTPGTEIVGFLPRDDAADVLISTTSSSLEALAHGSLMGTGAPRRIAQLLQVRPDLIIDALFRGSVDSRIAKMRQGKVDATILAAAGLKRAKLWDASFTRLCPETFLPALGQGTLAMQARSDDLEMRRICLAASCPDATFSSIVERECLKALGGDCFSAIAGWCRPIEGGWQFSVAVYGVDPSDYIRLEIVRGTGTAPEEMGLDAAKRLISEGARHLLSASGANGSRRMQGPALKSSANTLEV